METGVPARAFSLSIQLYRASGLPPAVVYSLLTQRYILEVSAANYGDTRCLRRL